MAVCGSQHKALNEDGVGKCSVPMWMNGCPAGFCDEPAWGKQSEEDRERNPRRYVPYLACPSHGGPLEPPVFVGGPEDGKHIKNRFEEGHMLYNTLPNAVRVPTNRPPADPGPMHEYLFIGGQYVYQGERK